MIVNLPELTPDECGEIAICAAEGGINYWAIITDYNWHEWDPYGEPRTSATEDTVFFVVPYDTERELFEDAVGDGIVGPLQITPQVIREGYQMLLTGMARHDLVSQALECLLAHEPGAVDAEVADCIIQLGCFGEIVYG